MDRLARGGNGRKSSPKEPESSVITAQMVSLTCGYTCKDGSARSGRGGESRAAWRADRAKHKRPQRVVLAWMDGSVCTDKGLDGHGHGGRGTLALALHWVGPDLDWHRRAGQVGWFGFTVECGLRVRGCHVLRARHPSRMLRQNEIHTDAAWTPRSLTTALTRQEVEEATATAAAAVAADAPGASSGSFGVALLPWKLQYMDSRREMGMDGWIRLQRRRAAHAERGNDCRDGRIVLLTTMIGRVTMVEVGEPLFGRHRNQDRSACQGHQAKPGSSGSPGSNQGRLDTLGKDGTERYLGS